MSIINAVFVPEGIVMSADSRLTGTGKTQSGDSYNYTISDNNQKIILLKESKVGISTCGDAFVQGKTISDFLRVFEINEIVAEDKIVQVASKLKSYLIKLSIPNTVYFFISGYHEDEPYVYEVRSDLINRMNYDSTNKNTIYNVCWNGQKGVISKLLLLGDPIKTNFNIMPLKDAIDYSKFLIETTIKYQRFNNTEVATCGGPIDTIVITKDGAAFIKHKIYNP